MPKTEIVRLTRRCSPGQKWSRRPHVCSMYGASRSCADSHSENSTGCTPCACTPTIQSLVSSMLPVENGAASVPLVFQ